jgi:hypothetical protein
LVRSLDQAVARHKAASLRAWVTFLSADQLSLDPELTKWARQHALCNVPLGVFEDAGGPPSYRLARDAEVTVLWFTRQHVVANFAFREGELSADRVSEVMRALPRVVEGK